MTAAQRQTRATSADELCRQAYAACAGPVTGVALVAVGGYGRGELAPHSDLDVVLVHDDDVALGDLANTLWYPLWDSGRTIDHSVRSVEEVLAQSAADLRVATGMLAALAVGGWVFIGFDACVGAAEETRDASRHVPRAIWMAMLAVGVLVILNAVAATLAHPDLPSVVAGADPDPVGTSVVASSTSSPQRSWT